MQVKQTFPRVTGAEGGFKWKDYCPIVFERLRAIFKMDSTDYLLSLTGTRCALPFPPFKACK